jgi:AcrR family transcriptional regulator
LGSKTIDPNAGPPYSNLMVPRRTPDVSRLLREQFADLAKLLDTDGVPQRALDSMLDIFLKQFMKLMDNLVGGDEPRTPRDRRRRRILVTATELFLRQGYARTTVDDIAGGAGVAKGTVYQYFQNKADVLVHAGALEKQRYMGTMRELFGSDRSPEDKLRRSLRTYFTMVHTLPLNSRIQAGDREMAGVLADMGFPDPQAVMDMQAAGLRFQMRRAAPGRWDREELERRSKVLIGLIHASSFIGDERHRGGLDVDEYAGTLADMLMDGIGEPCS